MKRRLLIGSVLAIVLCAIGTIAYLRTRDLASPESILARLPSDDASVLSIDFASLRRSGILDLLSGSIGEEEPEYKIFVEKTAFDYRRDLDHAFVSFHPSGVYFLVEGRFDWKRLEAYAREQGGGCFNSLCRMPGSVPSRKISFFPLKSSLMAMSVSADDFAATRMNEPAKNVRHIAAPKQPVWLSLPAATLKKSGEFPSGTQLFAKAMEDADAESATISLAPQGKAIEAQLEVVCRNAKEASVLAAQFQRVTEVLRQIIDKQKQKPTPADLAGVLTAGVFHQEDARVLGRWPIDRAFLDNLAGKPR
jgi:hypothetical protein